MIRKKLLSLFLAVGMVCTVFAPCAAAEEAAELADLTAAAEAVAADEATEDVAPEIDTEVTEAPVEEVVTEEAPVTEELVEEVAAEAAPAEVAPADDEATALAELAAEAEAAQNGDAGALDTFAAMETVDEETVNDEPVKASTSYLLYTNGTARISNFTKEADGEYNLKGSYTSTKTGKTYSVAGVIDYTVNDDKTVKYNAFRSCSLKGVTLPATMKTIGRLSFADCKNLTYINMPDSITTIGTFAFYNTDSLKSITFSRGMTSIPQAVCASTTGNSTLKQATIPEGVTTIEKNAFAFSKQMTDIYLPASLTTIEDQAFNYCDSLASVYFAGTQAQWDAIAKGVKNDALTKATLHVEHPYESFTTSKYTIYHGNLSWAQANEYCESVDGTLAAITTAEEQAAIASFNTLNERLWIGAKSDAADSWSWSSGEAWSYTNWAEGKPALKETVSYGVMNPAIWVDLEGGDVANQDGFICEWNSAAPTPTVTPAPTGEPTPKPATPETAETAVAEYVTRLYDVCLDRKPDAKGLADWKDQLTSFRISGTKAAYGFIFSKEFENKNLSDEDFVECLYKAIMGRASDAAGKKNWLDHLANKTSREDVFYGFANSVEFEKLCAKYGIVSKDIETYVTRLYKVCLDRTPDAHGLADWSEQLRTKKNTGRGVAYGFIFSPEFIKHDYSNEDYVEHLYAAFLGRTSDPAGKAYWVKKLKDGAKRETVFDGFVGSDEFTQICAGYGIDRGDAPAPTAAPADEPEAEPELEDNE